MAALFRRSFQTFLKSTANRRYLATGYGKSGENTFFEEDSAAASGKTTVTILNKEQDDVIFMDAYSSAGFRMNNGMRVMGPCAVFPRSVLHWNVRGVQDISEDSLSLFTLLQPKLDILVIGVGDKNSLSKLDMGIIRYLKSKRINVEILATDQALATFNFLNSERRYVAGAFIPPMYIEELGEDDIYRSAVAMGADPYISRTDYDSVTDEKGEFEGHIGLEETQKLLHEAAHRVAEGKSVRLSPEEIAEKEKKEKSLEKDRSSEEKDK